MMRISVPALTAMSAAVLLSACQSTSSGSRSSSGPGVTVTRLHLGQPIARGEIRVEPAAPLVAGSPAAMHFPHLSNAVESELARLGWTAARANARSEQVATVRVGPRAGGPGTELHLRIQRRSDATVLWEGRASTSETDLGPAIDQLVEALFRDFPGESGRTIRIR